MAGRQAAAGGRGREDPTLRVTPDVAAEAAVWVARLHGPDRSPAMERECLAWQARSAVHRLAFERCTETWQDVRGVSLAHAYAAARPTDEAVAPYAGTRRWAGALGVALLLVGGAALVQQWRAAGGYSTGIGEQHQVLLEDGTRLSLNTGTRVRVDLGTARREVSVQAGEVLFEVARDAQRPFVVRVDGNEVEALGTVFAVRLTPQTGADASWLAVTLIEGQVAVRPTADAGGGAREAEAPLLMRPGERVRLARAAAPRVDRPNLAGVVAWKRSEALFDDASLADAAAEMNRYSRTPIVLLDPPALAALRVSGLYRIGDSAGFARAVAALHGLRLQEEPGRLALAKPH